MELCSMASAIDPSLPLDGVPALKSDLRANLAAAKSEIEALQATVGGAVPTGYVAPETHGAIGDGATDDTAALNAAIAAAKAAGAGLWLRHGAVYGVDGRVAFDSWNDFVVCGNGATIKALDGMALTAGPLVWFRLCNRWAILDLRIDGNRTARGDATAQQFTENAFQIGGCTDFSIVRCRSIESPLDGVRISADGTTWSYRGLLVDSVFDRCSRLGIAVIEVHQLWIDHCRCTDIQGQSSGNALDPQNGIDIEPNPGSTAVVPAVKDVWITRCDVRNCAGGGIMVAGPSGSTTRAENVQILDNQVVNCGGQNGSHNRGTGIWASNGGPTTIARNYVECANTIATFSDHRGAIGASLDIGGPVHILDNRVVLNDGYDGWGIFIDRYIAYEDRAIGKYSTIRGNHVTVAGNPAANGGINVQGRTHYRVEGNFVLADAATPYGIYIEDNNITCQQITVVANEIQDLTNGYGICAEGTGHVVDRNICRNCENGSSGVLRTTDAVWSVALNTVETGGGAGIVTDTTPARLVDNLSV
jgi:hypothetical protein